MRFDGWDTMEGRHLVFAYAAIFIIQLGYVGLIARNWLLLKRPRRPD